MSSSAITFVALLFFLFVISVFVVLIVWGLKKIKRVDDVLSSGAAQRGWHYERAKKHYGYILQGNSARVGWKLRASVKEHPKDHIAGASVSTHWSTDDVNTPHLELMLRTQAGYRIETSASGHVASALFGVVSSALNAPKSEHDDLLKNGQHLTFQSSPLKESYVIIARDVQLVARLFDDRARDCLARWQTSPILSQEAKNTLCIDLGQNNLHLSVREFFEAMEPLEQLVELGVTLAGNYRGR